MGRVTKSDVDQVKTATVQNIAAADQCSVDHGTIQRNDSADVETATAEIQQAGAIEYAGADGQCSRSLLGRTCIGEASGIDQESLSGDAGVNGAVVEDGGLSGVRQIAVTKHFDPGIQIQGLEADPVARVEGCLLYTSRCV